MKLHNLSWPQKMMLAGRYVRNRITGYPLMVTIEMTQYCNAGCDFCNCWRTDLSPPLGDYVDMVKTLKPLILGLTGGEPMIRKELPKIIMEIKNSTPWLYTYIVTNGSLLTEDKASALFEAGLDQLSISINYLDSRLDDERKLDGLYAHIADLIPKLTRVQHRNVLFNTVIMEGNLDQVALIPQQAYDWGAKVSFSCYTDFKNGNSKHLISENKMAILEDTVNELIKLRTSLRNITNSEYYLKRIPEYFQTGGIHGCQAGKSFIQLTPDGQVRACPDFAPEVHYRDFTEQGVENHGCTKCWYACRGETEGALTPKRVMELIKWSG
jgi:MoaA/NifB/PqqE/SkfB family radical SAM enzyme